MGCGAGHARVARGSGHDGSRWSSGRRRRAAARPERTATGRGPAPWRTSERRAAQRRPPAAAAPAKSRTPLFIGVGVAVVVVLIAAFLLTAAATTRRTPSPAVTTTTTARRRRRRRSSSDSGTDSGSDSNSDFAPAGFITANESFEHGEVEVFVPSDWTDSFPVQLDNGEPRLRVAPDANAFVDGTFTQSRRADRRVRCRRERAQRCVRFRRAARQLPRAAARGRRRRGRASCDSCTPSAHASYPADLGTTSDGGFIGRFEKLTGCKGAGSIFVIFAGPADNSFILQVVIQTVTPDDEAAVPTIAGSILVADFP